MNSSCSSTELETSSCGETGLGMIVDREPKTPQPFRAKSENTPTMKCNEERKETTPTLRRALVQTLVQQPLAHHPLSPNSFDHPHHRVPLDCHLLGTFDKHAYSPLAQRTFRGGEGMFTPQRGNSQTNYGSPAEPGEIKWTIEELSALMPVEITDEEIINSARSPDPALEALIQAKLDVYWRHNVAYIPSPEVSSSTSSNTLNPLLNFTPSQLSHMNTPLRDFIMQREAMKSANANKSNLVKSPLQRPRRASLTRRMRNSPTQTDLTISPSMDFDFAHILGQVCAYIPTGEEMDEEEFNVSLDTSIGRRRLLFADDSNEIDVDKEDEGSKMFEPGAFEMQTLEEADELLHSMLGGGGGETPQKEEEGGDITCNSTFDAIPLSPITKWQDEEEEF